jgi:hypothetical protein
MPDKIMLTVAEPLAERLKEKMKKEGYLSVQELINAILREALISSKKTTAKKSEEGIDSEDEEFIDHFSEKGDEK